MQKNTIIFIKNFGTIHIGRQTEKIRGRKKQVSISLYICVCIERERERERDRESNNERAIGRGMR
jgi:hypothetical protein